MASLTERMNALERELADVEVQLADPALVRDQARSQAVNRRYKQLSDVVGAWHALESSRGDLGAAREMLSDATGDDRVLLTTEVAEIEAQIELQDERLRLALLPRDPNDDKNVIVEIRGAEGGEEANLFARDLFDMYVAYARRMGWNVEVLGSQPSDMGGFTDVAFMLKGDNVWSRLKFEAGPHRVQRVPVTESQGRIHTSSATVVVLPEAEELDLAIDENDLQIDVYRSSGPGGQSVNTTDSAVRITHKPTGLVVSMQDEKSQLQNRQKAMQVLRARLLKLEQDRQTAEASAAKRGQIGGGGRSEKIRTYNFKENRLTDHRIGLTLYKLDRILSGELDEVSDALMLEERERQLSDQS